jgi:predicted NBD/HSP70 family sugar kinase
MGTVYVGVDIGGTKVMAAAVSASGQVGPIARRTTPGRRVEVTLVEDALTEAVFEAADGRPVAGVGIAAAGFVDAVGERTTRPVPGSRRAGRPGWCSTTTPTAPPAPRWRSGPRAAWPTC